VKRQPHLRDQVRHIDPLNSVLPAVARTSIWGSRTRLGLDPVGSAKSQPHSGFAVGVRRRTPPAPPPRHPRQPWRWPSNLRRPIAELPTSNPGTSTPQHRCRSGSTSTRPGVCTPTVWCTIARRAHPARDHEGNYLYVPAAYGSAASAAGPLAVARPASLPQFPATSGPQ
jgi:hypothetical protein